MAVILTVEDEFFVSEYLKLLLEHAGFAVIATYNADDAIAVLESRTDIHTIITDINMPGSMDGLKLAAAVRDRWPPVKIIIVTGHNPPTAEEMPTGSLFVPKPYNAEGMIAAVRTLQ
jgi:two-component system, response regulator PdtaR